MQLFQKSVLHKYLNQLNSNDVSTSYEKFKEFFFNPQIQKAEPIFGYFKQIKFFIFNCVIYIEPEFFKNGCYYIYTALMICLLIKSRFSYGL